MLCYFKKLSIKQGLKTQYVVILKKYTERITIAVFTDKIYTDRELALNNLNFCVPALTSFPRATQIALASVVRRVFSQKHRKNDVQKYKNKYFCEVAPPIFILGFKFESYMVSGYFYVKRCTFMG